MLQPHPESNLELNIMVLGAEIIELLKKKDSYVLIEDLLTHFLKDERRTYDDFINSLTLLFALGIIKCNGYKVRLMQK